MLSLACQKLGITADMVIAHRAYDDRIVLVVDYGTAGGKKLTVPLSDLADPAKAKKEPEVEEGQAEKPRVVSRTPRRRTQK